MSTLILPRNVEVSTDGILYLQSDSNYTYIHSRQPQKKMLVAMSLCKIQDALNEQQFVRLNRRDLINIQHVTDYQVERKSVIVMLRNGQTFTSSRRRMADILRKLSNQI